MGGFNVMNNTSLIPGPKKLPAIAGWSAQRGGRKAGFYCIYIYSFIELYVKRL